MKLKRAVIAALIIPALAALAGGRFLSLGFERAEAQETARRVQTVQRALVGIGVARSTKSTPLFGRTFRAGEQARVEQMTGTKLQIVSRGAKRTDNFALVNARGLPVIWISVASPPVFSALRNRALAFYGIASLLLLGCVALLGRAPAKVAQIVDSPVQHSVEEPPVDARESEELFRQMAQAASDALYVMRPERETMEWFGQIDLMLGYANGSFPRTIDAWAEHIHPDEAARVIARYSEACKTLSPFEIEYRMRHRNGSYRDWSHRGKPVKIAGDLVVIGACSDVTERRRAERKLRASEERLARLVETVAEGIVICDSEGVVTFANPAAQTLFGADKREIIGRHYGDERWKFAAGNGAPLGQSELPPQLVAQSGEAVSYFEHSITHGSGRVVLVSVNAAPLRDEHEKISGAVLSLADITDRKANEERLMFQAFHDPLTKLPNRALFTDRLHHALIRAARSKTMIAVFFIDLDNFKKTNDTLGHDAGDALLIETAARICASIRGGDTAARLAGDEFTILLENITEQAQAKIVADRLLQAMIAPVEIKGESVYAPPSIGIALGSPGETSDAVLKNADAAMYTAKRNGKARYEFFVGEPEA